MKLRIAPFAVAFAVAGCAVDEPAEAELTSELDTVNPGVQVGSPFSKPFSWNWSADPAIKTPDACHNCSTTPFDATTEVKRSYPSLTSYVITQLPGWFAGPVPPAFRRAAADGDALLASGGTYDNVTDILTKTRDDLETLCAIAGVGHCAELSTPVSTRWTRGFPNVAGRHTERSFHREGVWDVADEYPLPDAFSELRLRGAKSYCAYRGAGFAFADAAGDPYSMYGAPHHYTDVLFWSVGEAGARIKLNPAVKYQDAHSEAFMMPLVLSSTINPLAGPMLPAFGELSHSLVWLSTDRERTSFEEPGIVHTKVCFSVFCVPVDLPTFKKNVRNLEHGDALAGVATHRELILTRVPLVKWGFFSLDLGGKIIVDTGVVDDPAAFGKDPGRVEKFGPFGYLVARLSVLDDLLTFVNLAADGALARNSLFVGFGETSRVHQAEITPPTSTRWQNNDDRAITVTDRIHDELTLTTGVGFNIGPVHVQVEGDTTAKISTQQDIVVREQLSLAKESASSPALLVPSLTGNFAQTNLIAVPHSTTTAKIDPLAVKLIFDVTIPTPFGDIDLHWDQPFFTLPSIPVGDDPFGGLESMRLRIGEYSDRESHDTAARQWPRVVSYLPGLRLFTAHEQPINACLADPTDMPTPPVPEYVPPPGPETRKACVVGPGVAALDLRSPDFDDTVCTTVEGRNAFASSIATSWWGNTIGEPQRTTAINAETICLQQLVDLVCSPVSKRVSTTARSHVLPVSEGLRYGQLVKQCTEAFASGTSSFADAKIIGDLIGKQLLPMVSCSADATPDPI